MTRDNGDRLATFSWGDVEVQRIALNRDQIDAYNPPPNPAKITDSRANDYIRKHGNLSWELDALSPSVLVGLIRAAIEPHIDQYEWDICQDREAENKELLRRVRTRWADVEKLLKDED
jgi:hypothetical protein